jgi:hypothetical protein
VQRSSFSLNVRPPTGGDDTEEHAMDLYPSTRDPAPGSDQDWPNAIAGGLGWFSIGLGLTELIAPQVITRALGMEGREGLVRSYGAREIAAGAGILATDGTARAPWMWARVGGDLLDIATVAGAPGEGRAPRGATGATVAMLAGVTLMDAWCASRLTENRPALRC